MKIAVLGATGQTGMHLVAQALKQGHEVTALVRNPGKLTPNHDNLKVQRFKVTLLCYVSRAGQVHAVKCHFLWLFCHCSSSTFTR